MEAAIVLPAMTFLILTMLQLTMVQHARIMTEYAAFAAARTGIVHNANVEAMERAAAIALSPTFARTDERPALDRAIEVTMPVEQNERMSFGTRLVRVQVLNPRSADFSGVITRHLNGQEIDFDDIRPAAARANQLQIQVRYMYRMSIPFANSILQNIWFASRLRILDQWTGMLFTNPEMGGQAAQQATLARAQGVPDLEDAIGIVSAARRERYYFPLQATYTMRMQSNAYLRNVQN